MAKGIPTLPRGVASTEANIPDDGLMTGPSSVAVAGDFQMPRTMAGGMVEYKHHSGRTRVRSSKEGRAKFRIDRATEQGWDLVAETDGSSEAFHIARSLAGY